MQILNSSFGYGMINSLNASYEAINRSIERLATGQKINRASDDPAGLIAADGFRSAVVVLQSKLKMLQRTDAVANTADGALAQISEMLVRFDSLSVTGSNESGISDEERDSIANEIASIEEGVNHILSTTTFNGRALFTSDLRLAANEDRLHISHLTLDFEGADTLEEKVARVKSFRSQVQDARARLGSFSRHVIGSQSRRIGEAITELTDAESMIRDTDVAEETASLARAQVLAEASIRSLDFLKDSMASLLKLIGVK